MCGIKFIHSKWKSSSWFKLSMMYTSLIIRIIFLLISSFWYLGLCPVSDVDSESFILTDMEVLMWKVRLIAHKRRGLANLQPVHVDPGSLHIKTSNKIQPFMTDFASSSDFDWKRTHFLMIAKTRRVIKHWNMWASSSFHFSQIN